jgi:ketosteroid isomerase-like protein
MEQRAIEVVIRTFEWFNDVMTNPRHVISRKEIEHRFTEDAQMIANGQLKCAGIAAHLKHFQELQKKLTSFRIRLPLEVSISTADEAAAYYKIDYVSSEGAAGVIHDSAIWRIRDGKFALMVETVSFEGKEVPLENHS